MYKPLKPGLSYWLAYDESLVSHRFRVIKYQTAFDTFYATEYGHVSLQKENGHYVAHITPKRRNRITTVFNEDEAPTDQDLLSLLIYWTVRPLFLAVPVPENDKEQTQQEHLF